LYSDEDILAMATPDIALVSIDAPLSLPRGRCCLKNECACAQSGIHLRKCDIEVRAMGIRILPLTIGPMRMLTERGIALKNEFERRGYRVIEAYPGGAQVIWGIPRQDDPGGLRRALKRLGIRGDISRKSISPHELDAITCALVGRLYLENEYLATGEPDEGQIIFPKPENRE
jgi:hypothetical protein